MKIYRISRFVRLVIGHTALLFILVPGTVAAGEPPPLPHDAGNPAFSVPVQNPVITGDNLYAPDLVREGSGWYCYYGGWKTTGQQFDRIYMATTTGTAVAGPWSERMIITNGAYRHVNDPTVVKDGDNWIMLYTAAGDAGTGPDIWYRDWINYSTSDDGLTWTPNAGTSSTEITISDPHGVLDGTALDSIARPSLVRDGQRWKLWFDGHARGGGLRSYLAETTATFPSRFELVHKYPPVEGFAGFMEPDVVKRADGTFAAVVQVRYKRLLYGASKDGISFDLHEVLRADDPKFGRKYVTNPGLIYNAATDQVLGFSFGMTDNDGLMGHDIGFWPLKQ